MSGTSVDQLFEFADISTLLWNWTDQVPHLEHLDQLQLGLVTYPWFSLEEGLIFSWTNWSNDWNPSPLSRKFSAIFDCNSSKCLVCLSGLSLKTSNMLFGSSEPKMGSLEFVCAWASRPDFCISSFQLLTVSFGQSSQVSTVAPYFVPWKLTHFSYWKWCSSCNEQ